MFHAGCLEEETVRETVVKPFLLRAKYERGRISKIRHALTHTWQQAGSYTGESDKLTAHMIAERQASIEGRIYLEAKQKGFKLLSSPSGLKCNSMHCAYEKKT